jgi:two-component system sensor histidine kinase DegS
MHDGPAQALSNLIVQAEITEKYFDFDPAKAKEELSTLKESAASTFQTIRNFIYELRPMMLDDLGLFPTVRRYVEAFKQQTRTQVNFSIYGQECRMEPYLEAMLFRALQELLRNAYQHNKDTLNQLRIDVQFTIDKKNIRLSVNDTGKGFNPDPLHENSGLGLKLIRERLEMLGGILEIDSSLNQGCNVIVQAPYIDVGVAT